jgi:hypothetical protein
MTKSRLAWIEVGVSYVGGSDLRSGHSSIHPGDPQSGVTLYWTGSSTSDRLSGGLLKGHEQGKRALSPKPLKSPVDHISFGHNKRPHAHVPSVCIRVCAVQHIHNRKGILGKGGNPSWHPRFGTLAWTWQVIGSSLQLPS